MIDLEKLNPFTNPIVVKCQGADTLPIDRILEFQGKLKRLSKKNREKLVKSICKKGFIAPLFLWDDSGEWRLLDGHGRLKTLLWMRENGWDIPLLPVDYIEAENETDAREKLLAITSQYGEFDMDELNEWVNDLDAEIAESIRIVDEEVKLDIDDFDDNTTSESEEITLTEKYQLILSFENEESLKEMYEEMEERGVECTISTL